MKRNRVAVIALLCLLTVGCIKKAGGGPVSPWERVMVNNAAFAQLNDDAEKGVIAANQSGLLSDDQARPIIKWEVQIAEDHKHITELLQQGPAAATSGDITAFLEQVKTTGNALVQSGGIGVKNPKTQQTVTQDIQSLVSLDETILSEVQIAKGGAH